MMTEQEYLDAADIARVRAMMAIQRELCLYGSSEALKFAKYVGHGLYELERVLANRIKINED
jgi:hypothetical protein